MPRPMTYDNFIEICEREHKRGAHSANYSKFDAGYAAAFKLCLAFAKELKDYYGKSLEEEYWTPERTKTFEKEMQICKGQRKDGRDGKCIDSDRHNLGCVGCPIGDGGLYEPEPINNNTEDK